ncbi:MAG TPA: replicative DNA helicase [bacterium]|nr:replicative DNA helicase [bacterium]
MSSASAHDQEELLRASGRIPPQSLEAEQAVLGAILLDNAACYTAAEHLKAEDFYRAPHQVLFQAMMDLGTSNQPVDVLTLTEYLRKKELLDAAGGAAYLAGLSDTVPSTANLVHYAKIVREKAVLRRLIHTASSIIQRGHEPGGDVDLFLDEAERTIFEIGQDRAKQGFVPVKDALKRTFKVIEQLYEKRGAVTGVPTGFSEIDKMTSGLQPGDLIIVAGRPSMGKTAFALNMAENAALHQEFSTGVAVFSLEMGTDQLVMRMLTSQGRVDAQKLRTGYASQRDLDSLVRAADRLSRAPIYIDDTPAITILEMRAKARRLQSEHGVGLIIVDYLQLMRGRPQAGQESREREISEISRGLKAIAKELKVPVIALSQLNRGVESRPNKRPMLSDLRESGAIEQDADIVCFIYRDEVYNKETEDKGIAEVIVGKHRNGPTGMVKLTFLGEYTKFENFAAPGSY